MTDYLGGTQFRLSDDGVSVTTRGGRLQKDVRLAKLDAGSRTYVLSDEQLVLTHSGPTKVKDLTVGKDSVAIIRNNPPTFGKLHSPNITFLLGVMAHSYDSNYQMITNAFTQEQRTAIEAAIPLAVKELGVEPKGPTYPTFVRVSTTDSAPKWVLTSSIFEQIREYATSNDIHDGNNVKAEIVGRGTFLAWLLGLNFFPDFENVELRKHFDDAKRRLNVTQVPQEGLERVLNQLEHSDVGVNVNKSDWVEVTSLSFKIDVPVRVFHFDKDSWVYPSYEEIGQGGLLCLSAIKFI